MYIDEAKKVFDIEIEALKLFRDCIDEKFSEILKIITECKGKIILTGMGKSGHIARKITATMCSLGTQAFYLHPAEALHGDLGMISANDIVIILSYNGESEEIIRLLPNIKAIGSTIVAISGNKQSTLVKNSDISQILPKIDEACYFNLAPTSSTTAMMVYGDALAVVASKIYGFTKENFALFHPSGALGKKLFMKVSDVMLINESKAIVKIGAKLKDAIVEISKKGLGMTTIVDDYNKLVGIITDGDLRRNLESQINIYDLYVEDIMTKNPVYIKDDIMAVQALKILSDKHISVLPVVDGENKVIGMVKMQDILEKGVIL